MTQDKFNKVENDIMAFCKTRGLQTKVSHEFSEFSFISDFGMEAIDTESLENPSDTVTKCYIVVYLPQVGEDDEDAIQRTHYQNMAWYLTRIAKPDYLLGVENGIVKAVMFCVWP